MKTNWKVRYNVKLFYRSLLLNRGQRKGGRDAYKFCTKAVFLSLYWDLTGSKPVHLIYYSLVTVLLYGRNEGKYFQGMQEIHELKKKTFVLHCLYRSDVPAKTYFREFLITCLIIAQFELQGKKLLFPL